MTETLFALQPLRAALPGTEVTVLHDLPEFISAPLQFATPV
jgi:hypothetical protein